MNHETKARPMYTCDICNFTTAYKGSLALHIQRIHEKKYSYKCDQCVKAFVMKHELKDHRTCHLGTRNFLCEICGNRYFQRSHLIHHKRKVHDVKNRPPSKFECELCDKTFATNYCLQNHIRWHSKKFTCPKCGADLATKYSLRMHDRIHTGERPYKCDQCSMAFISSGALTLHKFTHSDVKPYACDLCEKRFTQRSRLTMHRETHPGDHPPLPRISLVHFKKAADPNA